MGLKKEVRKGREDYLRVIYELGLGINNKVKSVDVAEKLGISKASVSEMLRKLADDGIVKIEPYSKVILTSKGMKQGESLHDKHIIIKNFLAKTLKFEDIDVHDYSHEIEHVFSDSAARHVDDVIHKRGIVKDIPSYIY